MRIKRNILQSALLIGALFFFNGLKAQGDILELLPGSEVLKFDKSKGLHRLIGNVNFKYQGNLMYCDSAHYYERQKIVHAYGNVHINKRDTINLFCDSLLYNGNTKKAKLWGNVRVRDSEYKLTTDTLDYDAGIGQGSYHHGGKVVSSLTQETLTSRVGYFYPNSKDFFFSHNVVYDGKELDMKTDTLQYRYSQKRAYFYGPTDIITEDATMFCYSGWYDTKTGEGKLVKNASIWKQSEFISGDTLIYLPDIRLSIGIGNVCYTDTTKKMEFSGEYAYSSDSLNYTLLTGRALAMKSMPDDTLYIHADTLYMNKIDSSDQIKAWHGARIYSTKIKGRADSLVYSTGIGKIELHEEPIVWSETAELKGVFMDMDVTDSSILQINIYDKSSILMEVEKELYYNQIAGKTIKAYFIDNDLKRALVNGNAMTVFFPEDQNNTDTLVTKKRMGMNRLYSSDLRIDIDSNEITGITYLEEPDGIFYPMDKIKKDEQFIPYFDWKILLKPKELEDLFKE